jgi:hypothetical protein
MFDSKDEDQSCANSSAQDTNQPLTERAVQELERIRARLDRELPPGPYFTKAFVAKLLGGMATKTLANRSSMPNNTMPRSFSPGGIREKLYPRHAVIDWLANEELRQLCVTFHRCR